MMFDDDVDDEVVDGVGVGAGGEIVIWRRHCSSPREAIYRSRTVAVGAVGRGAVPYSFSVAFVICCCCCLSILVVIADFLTTLGGACSLRLRLFAD